MDSIHYENQLLDAIETIVVNELDRAGYDKTIRAVVQSCLDDTIGKYKVKYQDSSFEAYSNNLDVKYTNGTQVYILVPKNDMSQTKFILNAVDSETLERPQLSNIENTNYAIVGENTLSDSVYELCSYDGETIITLYDRDNNINLLNYNEESFAVNLKDAERMLIGAAFKTSLDGEQRKQGNYGIIYEIDFTNTITGDNVTRSYIIDVNNMVGMPYNFNVPTNQDFNFDVDIENYKSVKSITIFAKNFPNTELGKPADIFISNFKLCATRSISDGCFLDVEMDKTYFEKDDGGDAEINATGILYLNGSTLNKTFEYYWFRQNNAINETNDKYNQYAGLGWECLNDIIITDSDNNEFTLVTDKNVLTVKKEDCLSITNHYKLMAVSDTAIFTKDFVIKNISADYELSIRSDQGTSFSYDCGNPTLTALVNRQDLSDDFTYLWAKIDDNGQIQILNETSLENVEYNFAVAKYNQLQAEIEAEMAMPAASQQELDDYLTTIKNYNTIQRVEKNHIYKTNISKINNNSTYICSVYSKEGDLIGTTSIVLNKKLEVEGEYTLSINNGTQTFNYSREGYAPTSKSLDNPIEIVPLSLTMLDNKGIEFTEDQWDICNIKWIIPENSMIEASDSGNTTLSYAIAEQYDINKIKNNNIEVEVTYKNHIYHAHTNFTFVKDGDPGTNGTGVICKIVPNLEDGEDLVDYPMLTNNKLTGNKELNFTPETTHKWFKVQLWENSTLLKESVDSGDGIDIVWENLINNYGNSVTDPHSFTINKTTGDFNYGINPYEEYGADIIKATVTYNGNTYYATLPLINLQYEGDYYSDYDIKLVKNTGFRYVMYSNDGRSPKYDNVLPFTLKVTQMIDGFEEDVSTIGNQYGLTYVWEVKGQKYNGSTFVNASDMSLESQNKNKARCIPNETYDGENLSNAIQVTIKKGNTVIAKIHIPIHFYLDRYGIAAINGWDGNSIALKNNEGIILTPQVGAGRKVNDAFTGILMGAVKESANKDLEEGLLGYSEGVRTLFLDATTGKATFGKTNDGQIIIDPSDGAKITGGGYDLDDPPNRGMLIDLKTPEIKWGNGNFSVNSNGIVSATGAIISGTLTAGENSIIGPWHVTSSSIWYGNANYGNANGLYFGTSGLSLGSAFQVTSGGVLTATGVDVTGEINATSGYIGNGANGWTIGSTAIYNGKTAIGNNDQEGVYLGVTGIGLGARNDYGTSSSHDYHSKFEVTSNGNLYASNAIIKGKIDATTGIIGGWTVGETRLSSGSNTTFVALDSGTQNVSYVIWAGANSPSNAKFKVTRTGDLTATSATITGTLTTGGFIGNGANGWTIVDTAIYNGTNSIDDTSHTGTYVGVNGIRNYNNTNSHHVTITDGTITANNAIITGDITANSLILKPTSTTIEKSSDQYAFDTYIEDNLLTKNKIVYIDKIGKRKFENIEVSGVKTGVKEKFEFQSLDGTIKNNEIDYTNDNFILTNVGMGTGSSSPISEDKNSGKTYVKIDSNGALVTDNAIVRGTIVATEGHIGGWTIKYQEGLHDGSSVSAANCYLGSVGQTYTIAGASRQDIVFKAGSNFGVNSSGNLFATGADISGTISASSGSIGGWSLENNKLYSCKTNEGVIVKNTYVGLSSNSSESGNIAIWAGHETASSAKFKVTRSGVLYATTGHIGNGTTQIHIGVDSTGNSAIYSGTKSNISANVDGFYLGENGIGLGPLYNYGTTLGSHSNFEVTSSGILYANNAIINGVITATEGYIGGWAVTDKRLSSGADIPNSNSSTFVALDSGTSNVSYAIWAGKENPAEAPFKVSRGGAITATSGSIGGWTLSNNFLFSSDGQHDNTYVGLSGYQNTAGDIAIWAGSGTFNLAPFRVTRAGAVTASNISITGGSLNINNGTFEVTSAGALTASSATISGTLTAGAGSSIGGWTATTNELYSGSGTGYVGLNSDTTSNDSEAIWAGSATSSLAPFRVTRAGAMTATSATITGSITATSLILGDGVTVPASKVNGLTAAIDDEIDEKIPDLDKVLYQGDVAHTRTTSADGHLITDTVTFKDSTGTSQSYTTYTSTSDGYVYTNVGIGTQDTSAHANNYVKISKNGLLEADNALIYGTIYAGAGQIGGWTISSSALSTASNALYLGTTGITATIAGASRSNIVFKSGSNFGVDNSGTLYATGADISGKIVITDANSTFNQGTIGGWVSTTTGLKNSSTTPTLVLSSSGVGPYTVNNHEASNWAIYANGNFGVDTGGNLYASNAIISGTLTAGADSKIGPWHVSSTSIWYGNATYGNANGLYFGTSGLSLGSTFQVTSAGALTATSVAITGTVNATAGDFGGGTNKIHVGTNGTSDVNSAIYSGSKSTFSSNNAGFYIGTDGISLGAAVNNVNPFQVDTTGAVTANNISITGGTLNINNGAFSVTNQGVLSATGATISGTLTAGSGSSIGGWTATDTRLYSGTNSGNTYVGLDSGTPNVSYAIWAGTEAPGSANFRVTRAGTLMTKNAYIGNVSNTDNRITISVTGNYSRIYNGKATLNGTANGFYIGSNGIALGKYNSTTGNPFQVLPTGALTATSATIKGAVDATSGSFGNGTSKITIGTNGTNDANSAIYSGSKTTFDTAESGFYIGTDGIALGSYDSSSSKNPFQVTTAGALTATSGTIGGWTLESKRLSSGSNSSYVALDSGTSGNNYAIWAGNATAASAPFSVTRSGKVTANDVEITGGTLSIGNNFSVTNTGILTAQGANIVTANVSNTLTVGGNANGKILVNNNQGTEIVKIDNTGIYFNGIDQSQTGAGSIIRSDGVYTSLFFQGINDRNDGLFGWWVVMGDNYLPNTICINYEIPDNFVATKAYITLVETPVFWDNVSGGIWGCATQVGIFKSPDSLSFLAYDYFGDSSVHIDDWIAIENVFSEETGSPPSYTYWSAPQPSNDHFETHTIKTNSLNLNYFTHGTAGAFYITSIRPTDNSFANAFNVKFKILDDPPVSNRDLGYWENAQVQDYNTMAHMLDGASRCCKMQAYLTVYGYTTVT